MRAGECADINLADLDIRHDLVSVQRGKGARALHRHPELPRADLAGIGGWST
nr:hypothetical protein [Nocardia brasiliensis]